MISKLYQKNKHLILYIALISLFSLAFLKIYVKIQTVIVGYEIGRLKEKEFQLLKQRSSLRMSLAQLTTKESLSKMLKEENDEPQQD